MVTKLLRVPECPSRIRIVTTNFLVFYTRAPSQYKDSLSQVLGIPLQRWDRRIFIMGNHIAVGQHLYNETGPQGSASCSTNIIHWIEIKKKVYPSWLLSGRLVRLLSSSDHPRSGKRLVTAILSLDEHLPPECVVFHHGSCDELIFVLEVDGAASLHVFQMPQLQGWWGSSHTSLTGQRISCNKTKMKCECNILKLNLTLKVMVNPPPKQ